MERARITIYDVARDAEVAISTVSRVLNESTEVAASTRARVQEAIERLQFQPDRTARALATKRRSSLVVAMPSATSLFYVEVLKGVKDTLRDQEMDLLLTNLGSQAPDETLRRFLNQGAVDGLLIIGLEITEDIGQQLLMMQAPVIVVGSQHDQFDSFYWDEVRSARLAAEHLIAQGHQRIGMIAAHPWSQNTAARIHGFKSALDAASIPFDDELIVRGTTLKHAGYSEEAGAEGFHQLIALENPPTAVFASSDVQAYGAWSAARDQGINIPNDLALIGHDGLKLSRFLDLSTMDLGLQEVGRRAAERLIARMSGDHAPISSILADARLVPRASSMATAPRTGT